MICRSQAKVKFIKERFVWPNMIIDICELVTPCLEGQKCKVNHQTKTTIGNFTNTDARFTTCILIFLDLYQCVRVTSTY